MLDDNLPTFFVHAAAADAPLTSAILLRSDGAEPQPAYSLRRPDPARPESANRYAVALCDSFNLDVLYAEVLVEPEWTQPTLSAAEIRAQAQHGAPPGPVPVVPAAFAIQLYNPDQQIVVKQIPGSWNSSAHWEFEMPQQTFRLPSASALDQSQHDPAASLNTPKLTFKWKRDGKLTKDITCFLSGKQIDGKKSKEPDITVAMFKRDRELTVYEPNMNRVELEDAKGFELVLLLSAIVTKEIYFNPSKDLFNINASNARRKSSGAGAGASGRTTTSLSMTGALPANPPPPRRQSNAPYPPSQQIPDAPPIKPYESRPPADPRAQHAIEAETARLKAQVAAEEKQRRRREQEEEKMVRKMLEQEEKERKRRDAEVAKETERLRKKYGTQPPTGPHVHVTNPPPALPPRPLTPPTPQHLAPSYHAPYAAPPPPPRPSSNPGPGYYHPPVPAPYHAAPAPANTWWPGPTGGMPPPPPRPVSAAPPPGPYLQPSAYGGRPSGSASGFFNWGSREAAAGKEESKLKKKRSSMW